MSPSVEVILLDIDGTLLNTELYILSAFRHAAQQHGLELPPDAQMTANIGRPLDRIYAELGAKAADIPHAIETHRIFQEENLHLVGAYGGADLALRSLRSYGFALGAVTSRSRRTSTASLKHAGIGDHFSVVISAEDALALKPDPGPLRAALFALGFPVATAIMVGDTVHDIEAGKALGMRTIGATYGFGGAAMTAAAPTLTINSVRDLPRAVLRLNRRKA